MRSSTHLASGGSPGSGTGNGKSRDAHVVIEDPVPGTAREEPGTTTVPVASPIPAVSAAHSTCHVAVVCLLPHVTVVRVVLGSSSP